MIAFLPHCGFLSEVSRAIGIARALRDRGVPVAFGARGGPYAHLVTEAGFACTPLDPAMDGEGAARFLRALLSMGKEDLPLYADDELERAVDAEVAFLRETGARAVVTGFTLSAYVSSRVAGIPLVTDHGGSFVPPVLWHGLCPAPVNPPTPALGRLPERAQRWIANRAPAFFRGPTRPLNRCAARRGVEPVPGLMGLMYGDVTLVTELPEVLGLPREAIEAWAPRWPFRLRGRPIFRCTGPLYARLDRPIPPEVDAFLSAGRTIYLAPTSVTEPFLRDLVRAAKRAGERLLVAATVHDVADLADERTLIASVLPNRLVVPRVAAAVIMGGQGSVQTAIASGTPFVGLPYHPEQELNVAVAERLGAAIRLSPGVATTDALARALRRLLDEPAFAAGARRAARAYEGVDGAARAAEVVIEAVGLATCARPERAARSA